MSLIPPFLSKVRGCRCCFSLATLGGAVPLCRWLTGGGCGCVYCYNVRAPALSEEMGQSRLPNTDLRSQPPSADYSLCLREGYDARSVPEGNSSPRSGLRWRRSWGETGRGAEHRGSDSDGLLATRCRPPPFDESADDSEPPGSSGYPAVSSV